MNRPVGLVWTFTPPAAGIMRSVREEVQALVARGRGDEVEREIACGVAVALLRLGLSEGAQSALRGFVALVHEVRDLDCTEAERELERGMRAELLGVVGTMGGDS